MGDKVLIGNNRALQTKYGKDISNIQDAVVRFIAADQGRELHTIYVTVDDPQAEGDANGTQNVSITNPHIKRAANAITSKP